MAMASSFFHHFSTALPSLARASYVDITGREVDVRIIPNCWTYQHDRRLFVCLCCFAQFGEPADFVVHMRYHAYLTGPNPLHSNFLRYCPICKIRGDEPNTFSMHVMSHAIIRRRSHCCTVCHQAFPSREILKQHLAVNHVLPFYRCAVCNASYESYANLMIHMEARHLDGCEHWICYLCPGLVFSNQDIARGHIGTHHGVKLSTVPCPISHKSLVCSTYQIMNIGIFRKYFPTFICPICEQVLQEECLYIMHVVNDHVDLVRHAAAGLSTANF